MNQNIPETFKRNRYTYQIKEKHHTVIILSQYNKQGNLAGYEVHKLHKKNKVCQINGKLVNNGHNLSLASNEEFGRYAWYYQNLSNAERKYTELIESGTDYTNQNSQAKGET